MGDGRDEEGVSLSGVQSVGKNALFRLCGDDLSTCLALTCIG